MTAATPPPDLEVRDAPEHRRYEIRRGEDVAGYTAYVVRNGTMTFLHTEVDPAFQGQGIGSRLARGALDDARARGLRVAAECPFITSYLRRHREYDDIVAGPGRDAIVEDVTFDGDVRAWLVRPPGDGTIGGASSHANAGIVMWHWLSTEEPIGSRDEFLDEARALAVRGAVCLLPQGRFPWSIAPNDSASDAREIEAEVARLSRGLDLLAERDDVDADRLAIVGHDFGAMLGMVVAAREDRVGALAAIAPTPRWGDWFLPFWRIEEDRIDYLRALRPLDPIEQMGSIAPRPMLLQLARQDFFVPLMAGFELRRAAAEGPAGDAARDAVSMRVYDAEHDLDVDDAIGDRAEFLAQHLGLR